MVTLNFCVPTLSAIDLLSFGKNSVIAGASFVFVAVIFIVFESVLEPSLAIIFTLLPPTLPLVGVHDTVASELFAAFVNAIPLTFALKERLSLSASKTVMLKLNAESSAMLLSLISSSTGSLFVFVTPTCHSWLTVFELLSSNWSFMVWLPEALKLYV